MTQGIKTYRDLLVWQKSIDLVKFVYQVSSKLPDTERFGLVSQLQRAAVSIPSNIAEGWGRETKSYFLNFLRMSKGSLAELDTLTIVIRDLNYIEPALFEILNTKIEEVSRMLNGLIRKLNQPKVTAD
jgi:four helix bundle protein